MSLAQYNKKRDFDKTEEPQGKEAKAKGALRFVVQKHDASSVHYDFRLEMDGALKSWAVPKGPSLNPADKRLAMRVEDHPIAYRHFEGVIPAGEYGGGTVIVWDEGWYQPADATITSRNEQEESLLKDLAAGRLSLVLHGQKLNGGFALTRMRSKGDKSWLLTKKKDEYRSVEDVTKNDRSAKSGKTLAEVAHEHGVELNHPEKETGKAAAKTGVAAKTAKEQGNEKTKQQATKAGTKFKTSSGYTASKKGDDKLLVVNGHELQLTNLQKLYWPTEKFRKGDVVAYYRKMAPFILPHLLNRPQSLHRHPNGIQGSHFFQKDVRGKVPDWMDTVEEFSESTGVAVTYLVCSNEATLVYMANLGCVEINPWHVRKDSLLQPDWCLVDLDPHTGNSFDDVIEVAQVTKKILDAVGAEACVKTSGASGLHLYLPLGAEYSFEQSRALAEALVKAVHAELPKLTSLERAPAKRKNKIYLDFLQNSETQTAAAPYSLRPKPGVPVSTPLDWSEVKKGLTPTTWNAFNVYDRVKVEGDLFAPVLGKGIALKTIMKNLEGLVTGSAKPKRPGKKS